MSYPNQPPYALPSMSSLIRERIALAIESETPELAPEMPFTRHVKFPTQAPEGDDSPNGGEPGYQQLEQTSDPQRWRAFRVRVIGGWGKGSSHDSGTGRNYALRVVVEIGYPAEALLKVDPNDDSNGIYDVDDLIGSDFEQLDDVLNGDGIFNANNLYNEPEISTYGLGSVENIELLGTTFSGRVHRIAYLISYERRR